MIKNEEQQNAKDNNQHRGFKQIVNTLYNEEIESIKEEKSETENKGTIKIEPQIIYDKFSGDMKIEFKIGKQKMYKIKNLSEFYTRMINGEFYKYGEKLQFTHSRENFEEESINLLDFILKYAEIIKYANSNSNSNFKYYGKVLNESNIIIGNSGIDELFDIMKNKQISIQKDYKTKTIEFTEKQPNIEFKLKKEKDKEDEYVILPNIEIYNVAIIKGKEYKYILDENKLYRCTKEFENGTLKLLEIYRKNYITELTLGKSDLPKLFSIFMPKVQEAINVEDMLEEIKKYKPEDLIVKVYLDFDKNNYLIADVKFNYIEDEFNPLDEKAGMNITRNLIQETKALNMFRKTGFMFDTKNIRFILPNEDKIYQFLTQDIENYMQKFQVLVTDNFKTKKIRQTKIGGLGVRINNDLLQINFEDLEIDKEELKEIMKRYSLKKKYYRLKDGSFINLENNKEVEFLDKIVTGMDIEYQEIIDGEINIPLYRSLYLNRLLKTVKGINITKDNEYKNLVDRLDKEKLEEDIEVPQNLDNTLRFYQKTGFKWLKILDYYKFGGILADDMGLGKTIQVLSIILNYIINEDENIIERQETLKVTKSKKTSLVIAPSSLTLNWQNEAEKYAKELKTIVIMGNYLQRKELINNIENYDLVITSYELLKRDIELYKEYEFRYVIADEAQYLKNSNTQNAKSIKQIKAETRYALTGTPIENSLSELWSIFDFIMPGYLFSYKKFKALYEVPIIKDENQEAMNKLKMLIEPFILRRTKKEVLTELPEKTVTVLNNEMEEEQKNIYLNYLAQTKQEISEQIDINGYENSHIQILAALTRLRQICCHPSLFLENYKSSSSKLEQCLEIIEEAINSGHKILLFSGYTSMFEIIEKELKQRKIEYYKLTGATKVEERMKLVDEFNQNSKAKLFLISLKAGGTGLNLTGADMVIHYDPWWNVSTENQATDRAYRIGQKHNVQVYKLITKNSIEEKIYELQQKKSILIDSVLDTKASFINKLSKEEIMDLFN